MAGILLLGGCAYVANLKPEWVVDKFSPLKSRPVKDEKEGLSPSADVKQECGALSPFLAVKPATTCISEEAKAVVSVESVQEGDIFSMQALGSHFIFDMLDGNPTEAELSDKIAKIPYANTDDWIAFGIYLEIVWKLRKALPTSRSRKTQFASGFKVKPSL